MLLKQSTAAAFVVVVVAAAAAAAAAIAAAIVRWHAAGCITVHIASRCNSVVCSMTLLEPAASLCTSDAGRAARVSFANLYVAIFTAFDLLEERE
jgi:hypothetical protein